MKMLLWTLIHSGNLCGLPHLPWRILRWWRGCWLLKRWQFSDGEKQEVGDYENPRAPERSGWGPWGRRTLGGARWSGWGLRWTCNSSERKALVSLIIYYHTLLPELITAPSVWESPHPSVHCWLEASSACSLGVTPRQGHQPGPDPSRVLIGVQMFCLAPLGPLPSDSWDRKPLAAGQCLWATVSSSSWPWWEAHRGIQVTAGEEMMWCYEKLHS